MPRVLHFSALVKKMYEASRSAVFLEGEKSAVFRLEQGVAQGCSLSPILFSVFINDLLKVVEQAKLSLASQPYFSVAHAR